MKVFLCFLSMLLIGIFFRKPVHAQERISAAVLITARFEGTTSDTLQAGTLFATNKILLYRKADGQPCDCKVTAFSVTVYSKRPGDIPTYEITGNTLSDNTLSDIAARYHKGDKAVVDINAVDCPSKYHFNTRPFIGPHDKRVIYSFRILPTKRIIGLQ